MVEINLLDQLRTICCHAAIELDNLRLSRNDDFQCTTRVRDWLSASFISSERSSSAVIAVKNAMIACNQFNPSEREMSKLLEAVTPVRDLLLAVVINPSDFVQNRYGELVKLTRFCVELSKTAEEYEL